MSLLEIEGLEVTYRTPRGPFHAVRGVSLSVDHDRLGLVGESGSGKSTVGRAILRLLPETATIKAERMDFQGRSILLAPPAQLREWRGRRIGLILQDPKYSLNPVMTIGQQIAETHRVHLRSTRAMAKRAALDMLDAVAIRDPERVYGLYPHEVSGGMGQRAMIAMMLVAEPELLIADEPTSALDVTVQAQILALLDRLARRRGMGLLLISHNLPLVGSFCDRVAVMYGGRLMETVRASLLGHSRHPYTQGLLRCRPLIDVAQEDLPTFTRDPAWADP